MFVSGFYTRLDPVLRPSVGSILASGVLIDGVAGTGQIIVSTGSINATGKTPALPSTTLTGYTVQANRFNTNATATIKVDNDGNTYQEVNGGSPSQVNSSTDWMRPTDGAPADYEVRYTDVVVNAGSSSSITATVSAGTWHPLSTSDFSVSVTDTSPDEGIYHDISFQIEIRNGSSGGAEVSGTYRLIASRVDSF